MSDATNTLAVMEPGDGHQVEVIAGDALQALEQAWEYLNTDTPPDALTANMVQALIITAHERVEQLEKFGEVAISAIAGIQESMKIVEEQRDEAVQNMVVAEENFAELRQEFDAEVEQAVETQMDYAEENFDSEVDWAELRQEAEENFDSEVDWTAMRLKGWGEAEAAEDLLKKLREAKQLRNEVARLAEQYDRLCNEKDREKRRLEWAENHPGEPLPVWLSSSPVMVEDDDEDDPDLDLDEDDDTEE